mmetsp:Transcript_62778/g.141775  ORF Transcript_62778/g.141775 Transcript_62778/m.141775 type:complete len:184 (+) Transcript_62778:90-641(+)
MGQGCALCCAGKDGNDAMLMPAAVDPMLSEQMRVFQTELHKQKAELASVREELETSRSSTPPAAVRDMAVGATSPTSVRDMAVGSTSPTATPNGEAAEAEGGFFEDRQGQQPTLESSSSLAWLYDGMEWDGDLGRRAQTWEVLKQSESLRRVGEQSAHLPPVPEVDSDGPPLVRVDTEARGAP